MSEGEGQAEGVDNAEGEGAGDALGPEQGGADGDGARGFSELFDAGLQGVLDACLNDAALRVVVVGEDAAYGGERAHQARAWYSTDALSRRLERGEIVGLWGHTWQVRTCRNLGMGTGEIFGLTLTRQPVKRGA